MVNSGLINVIIADDSQKFMEGLKVLFNMDARYNLLETHSNGEDLVNSPNLFMAKIIITDIEMPRLNGLEAAKKINFMFPNMALVALTMYIDKVYLNEIIGAGFKAFIHKPEIATDLFKVLNEVMENRYVFPEKLKIDS
ncbi:MAG: response regulator transcription factor [Bacteroidales bacterium]|nr:response regulator transcription factor [Bacteroidales bacterium]